MDDVKLEDPAVAYAYAGWDVNFTIFKLYTEPVTNPLGEPGVYEFSYKQLLPLILSSSDPLGYIRLAINTCLQKCTVSTGLPKEKWIVEFSPVLAHLNLPSHLFLSNPADLEWIS